MNVLKPTPSLLAKLGSLVYHMEEFLDTANPLDRQAAMFLREDSEVEEWFAGMTNLAMVPLKRPKS